jgi:hypothetical protein
MACAGLLLLAPPSTDKVMSGRDTAAEAAPLFLLPRVAREELLAGCFTALPLLLVYLYGSASCWAPEHWQDDAGRRDCRRGGRPLFYCFWGACRCVCIW